MAWLCTDDAWVGHRLGLGSGGAGLDVAMRTMRCAVPLRPQPAFVDATRTAHDGDGAHARRLLGRARRRPGQRPDGAGAVDSPVAAAVEAALDQVDIAGPVGESLGLILDSTITAAGELLQRHRQEPARPARRTRRPGSPP